MLNNRVAEVWQAEKNSNTGRETVKGEKVRLVNLDVHPQSQFEDVHDTCIQTYVCIIRQEVTK